MESIRKVVEDCNDLDGFIIYHSQTGGTGSGLTSQLLNKLTDQYPTSTRMQVSLAPSLDSSSTTPIEIYNSLLSYSSLLDTCQTTLCLDNESLFNYFAKNYIDQTPNFSNMNKIIARLMSHVLNPVRFGGVLYNRLDELVKCLVPSSTLHHHIAAFSSTPKISSLFEHENKLISCDYENGEFLKSCVLFSSSFKQADINEAIESVKSNKRFIFIDEGLKTEIIQANGEESLACLLGTHTGIGDLFRGVINEYDSLSNARPFLHWYEAEGVEKAEFEEHRGRLYDLVNDYNSISRAKSEKSGRESEIKNEQDEPSEDEVVGNVGSDH